MTKAEARAILAFQKTVNQALVRVRDKLSPKELSDAEAYWWSHITNIINDAGWGAVPVAQAKKTLGME